MLRYKIMLLSLAVAIGISFSDANAETLNIRYDGVVRSNPIDSLLVRDANGQFTQPSQAQLPSDYPYKAGDTFSLSFTTEIPTREVMTADSINGQYRLPLVGTGTRGAEFGTARNVDLSGPASLEQRFPYNFSGVDLVYDVQRDQIFLDDRGGEWSFAPVDFPALERTGPNGAISVRGSSCFGILCESSGLGARINGGTFTVRDIPLVESDPASPQFQTRQGIFQFITDGLFSIPYLSSVNNGGNPTDVPEPSMMLLFGMSAGAVVWRRRRTVKAK